MKIENIEGKDNIVDYITEPRGYPNDPFHAINHLKRVLRACLKLSDDDVIRELAEYLGHEVTES